MCPRRASHSATHHLDTLGRVSQEVQTRLVEKAELSLPQLALRDLGLLTLLRQTQVTDDFEHLRPSQASEQIQVIILSIKTFLSHSIFSFNHLFKR